MEVAASVKNYVRILLVNRVLKNERTYEMQFKLILLRSVSNPFRNIPNVICKILADEIRIEIP